MNDVWGFFQCNIHHRCKRKGYYLRDRKNLIYHSMDVQRCQKVHISVNWNCNKIQYADNIAFSLPILAYYVSQTRWLKVDPQDNKHHARWLTHYVTCWIYLFSFSEVMTTFHQSSTNNCLLYTYVIKLRPASGVVCNYLALSVSHNHYVWTIDKSNHIGFHPQDKIHTDN